MSLLAADSAARVPRRTAVPSPMLARASVVAALALGMAGTLALGRPTTTDADAELLQLLRLMAVLKAALASGLAGAVLWRLGMPVGTTRLTFYATACGAMAAGPTLIWSGHDIGAGALLLHGGLFATGLMLWRDPAVAGRVASLVARRRC